MSAGFGRLLHAEWTKFRTVRGWLFGVAAAAAAVIGFGVLPGMSGSCHDHACRLPTGPDGTEVTDSFTFAHRSLTGDGSITARLASLTGILPPDPGDDQPQGEGPSHGPATPGQGRPGLVPWAKAGLIIRAGSAPGAGYAAVMLTGTQGVRMQHDYIHDVAGPAASADAPRWLRLTRTGDTVTGQTSADGSTWTQVATVRLPGLPATVEAGMFATSPQYTESTSEVFGLTGAGGGPTRATGSFDRIVAQGGWSAGTWQPDKIGGPDDAPRHGAVVDGDQVTITGSGDLAPAVSGAAGLGTTITQTLVGTFAGLIIVVVIATMFVTAEYGHGLMRTTMAANPRRGRILAAKTVVIGTVTFVTALASAATTVTVGRRVLEANGVYVHSVSALTQVRVIVGTAALLALASVLALALGVILRRSAAAVTTAVLGIVMPYLLAVSVLPATAGQWLLRVTPAAAFALQQSTLEYPQVINIYTPVNGYYPLPPWAGLAVLCAWTGLALGVAAALLRRRDA
ncbi:ABC transporter permease subunit [Catellatospora sichuanensis]|uniref:ABC transporter permease subunit n=1 Tax=Catellatospora sichuanensis TaxID=1969805 RepID=UPI001181F6F4|nr:ABC transporter permease subunit [Catellatospora sichuanensis]